MRTSEFLDKQIMELSRSKDKDSFSFFNPDEESDDEFDGGSGYDFHPHLHHGASQSRSSALRGCSSMNHIDSVKVTREDVGVALVSQVGQTIKEHFDNLLHSVDGLSARLSQLESKTHQIENAVDNLKVSAEYNNGKTEGKLRQLENILREVQDGINYIRDKQEITETQIQLAKLQCSKGKRESEDNNTAVRADSSLPISQSASEQFPQSIPVSGALPLALPTAHSNAPSSPLYGNATPTVAPVAPQVYSQMPHNPPPYSPQPQSYYFPSGKTSETTYQQYNVHPPRQAQPPSPVSQLYQPAPNLPQVSQSVRQPQLHPSPGTVNFQNQPLWSHHAEEPPHMPSHNYQESALRSSSLPPHGPLVQQFYMDSSSQQMHGQPSKMPNAEFPDVYSQTHLPANLSNMHGYGGPSSHYSSSPVKASQIPHASSALDGGNNYTQLLKAPVLPHALPTASMVDAGSSSGGTGKKVPIDDVVDKVTAMGFRRDLVRATVKRLTDNGQSVDLNVVLDKLMND